MYQVVLALIMAHVAPNSVPPKQLATEIIKQAAAFDVDPILVTQIMLQESKGIASAFNAKSKDYGLMQINEKTAKALNVSQKCLSNWKCNLKVGVGVLAQFSQYEDFNPCHYNTGRRGSKTKTGAKKCSAYNRNLNKFTIAGGM